MKKICRIICFACLSLFLFGCPGNANDGSIANEEVKIKQLAGDPQKGYPITLTSGKLKVLDALAPTFTFTVASCNVLKEDAYKKHFDESGTKMDIKIRRELFKSAFSGDGPFAEADVIALQEYVEKEMRQPTDFYFVNFEEAKLGLGYNPFKFKIFSEDKRKFKTEGAEKNGFVCVILQPSTTREAVGIINVHLRGGAGPEKNYIKFRQDQLAEITQVINEKSEKEGVKHWILCGDFNTDGLDDKIYKTTIAKIALFDAFDINRQANSILNMQGKVTDYILYKGLTMQESNQYPNIDQLLTHGYDGNDDSKKSYFSDHSVIWAIFSF